MPSAAEPAARPTPADRRVLIHVQGSLRSGSTLLETLLTQHPGTATVGESINLYRFLANDLPCTCGRPLRECPIWGQVAADTGLLAKKFDVAAYAMQFRQAVRIRSLHRTVLGGRVPGELRDMHRAVLERFADLTGARTLIDTSKNPAMPRVVDGPGWNWESAYIHLVRDPRAVAFSDSRKSHEAADEVRPPRRNPAVSAGLWELTNALIEWSRRTEWAGRPFVRIRYEDLTSDLPGTMRELVRALPITQQPLHAATATDPQAGPEFTLSAHTAAHAIGGNPGRPHGMAFVKTDDRWRNEMPERDRIMVSALTRRLRRRYGYP